MAGDTKREGRGVGRVLAARLVGQADGRTCAVEVHGPGDNDTKPANASGACEWAGTVGRQEWVCVLGQGWLPPLQAGMAMGSNS